MDFTGQYSIDDSDYGREQRIGQADVPFTDALSSSASDAWVHNPSQAIGDMSDYYLAQHPEWRAPVGYAGQALDAIVPGAGVGLELASQASQSHPASADNFVDPHTLNQKYGQSLGLSFDQPMRQGAVDILVKQKQQQDQRNYVLAHAPSGLAYETGYLATDLAASALDPLNVAAAFVPVVGEARAAMWAARYGPTLARVGEGAIEGAAGTAALQPIEAAHASTFQEQYGALDAFTNVAFGTILGGGLHAGFGKLSDWLSKAAPETREAALRSAVAQQAEGRRVDVSAVLASDPKLADYGAEFDRLSASPTEASTAPEAPTAPAGEPTAEPQPAASPESSPNYPQALDDVKLMESKAPTDQTFLQAIQQHGGIRTRDADGKLTPLGGDLMSVIGDNPGHVMNIVNNTARLSGSGKVVGWAPDQMAERLKEDRWLPPDADTNDLTDAISRSVGGEKIYHPESEVPAQLAYRDLVSREFNDADITSADSREQAAAKLAQFRDSQGAQFALDEQHDIAAGEQALSPEDLKELQSDDDWIGSDEWLARESGDSGGDEAAAGGVSQAGAVGQDVGPGAGDSAAAGGEAGGARPVPAESRDALDDARTASEKFGRNQEPSTIAPPDAGARAEAQVKSGSGDDIDAELAEAERRVADYKAQGIISDDESAAVDAQNTADAQAAQSQSAAAKAAARCLFLHP